MVWWAFTLTVYSFLCFSTVAVEKRFILSILLCLFWSKFHKFSWLLLFIDPMECMVSGPKILFTPIEP